jgi:hypothetical protein
MVAVATGYLLVHAPSAPMLGVLITVGVVAGLVLVARVPRPRLLTEVSSEAGTLRAALTFLLIVLAGYILLFNYLPTGGRLRLADVLGAGFIALAFAIFLTTDERSTRLLLAVCLAIPVVNLIGAMLLLHPVRATGSLRLWFPLLIAAAVVLRPQLISARTAGWVAIALILGGAAISFAHGSQLLYDTTRLSPFTGGAVDGIHSSAFVLAISVIILNEVRRQGLMPIWIVLPAIGVAVLMMWELKVATAIVLLLVYFGWGGIAAARSVTARLSVVGLALIAVIAIFNTRAQDLVTAPYGSHSVTADSLSSGRLGGWQGRLDLIDSRNVGLLVFGSGIGSDLLSLSSAWGGSDKDSHNDLLAMLFNQGLLGLIVWVIVIVLLAKLAGPSGWPIVAAFAVTSGLSNALYSRPMIEVFLWLAVGIAIRWIPRASG